MFSLFRGKGYREKISSLLQSVPSFISFKLYQINESLVPRRWGWRDSKITGKWFIDISDTHYWQVGEDSQNAGMLCDVSRALGRQFTILGAEIDFSKREINWHHDPFSNFEWSMKYYSLLYPVFNGTDHTDGKIPYELSRMQHLPLLIKGYFITGHDAYVAECVGQLSSWIDNNALNHGVNWTCAMDVAIRICNWLWAWWAFRNHKLWDDLFNQKFLESVWQHGWYIERHLENRKNIRTNHYLSDIVGLLFIGIVFPQFRESESWKRFGIEQMVRSMEDMVYPDGVNFENSTAYHRLTLELFAYSAILCRKNRIELPDKFWKSLELMFEFIMYCNRPDGRMPLVGDSDDGRFMILSDYFEWDRRDFRYLLAIGALLYDRSDFKMMAGRMHEEIAWLFGYEGIARWECV